MMKRIKCMKLYIGSKSCAPYWQWPWLESHKEVLFNLQDDAGAGVTSCKEMSCWIIQEFRVFNRKIWNLSTGKYEISRQGNIKSLNNEIWNQQVNNQSVNDLVRMFSIVMSIIMHKVVATLFVQFWFTDQFAKYS